MTRAGSILVVDDVEANREVLSRLLRHRGYEVVAAGNGREALILIDATVFDLVLLDVQMPSMSGLEVLTRIREKRSSADLPVIMVTAQSLGEDVVEALRLGANDHVTKPVDLPVLLARVSTQLSLKRTVALLRESEERYALAARGSNDGLWDWNLRAHSVHWSSRWKAMLGFEESELGDSPDEWLSRVHEEDRDRLRQTLTSHLGGATDHFECEHRLLHRDGTFRWVLCRGLAIRTASGEATRMAGSLTDITHAKGADVLTGLPNRLLFDDVLRRAIERSQRRVDYAFALLAFGLDRFQSLCDSLGPHAIDRLLTDVARRLHESLQAATTISSGRQGFTLARMGGDEFVVLLDDIRDAGDAVALADRMRAAFDSAFAIDHQTVFAPASVGVAVSTSGYECPEDVCRDAAIALHRAKVAGGQRCELFDAAMRQQAIARLRTETHLRVAVEEEAFELRYQPILLLATGEIAGFEALVRWQHPDYGLVNPSEFIPVAEDTGLILQIGRMVLEGACQQMADWRRRFGPAAPAFMCVNVSSRQFTDPHLADQVQEILQRSQLPPSSLKLEITESAFLADLPAAQATMRKIRSMGIEWSLDDFGTGYSSLSYLHRLPVGTVKIDRSFICRVGTDAGGHDMVGAVVSLAHTLRMDVVAEGVETHEQVAALEALGCEYGQGYYFSRPADAATAERFIASEPWRLAVRTAQRA